MELVNWKEHIHKRKKKKGAEPGNVQELPAAFLNYRLSLVNSKKQRTGFQGQKYN